jgi:MCP family monocarboxylic acid transporter-like MFS transporter 10
MIQRLIPRIGFGWSMRVLFFIEIVMLTVAWFTIRLRVPPAIDVRDKRKGGWAQVKWIDLHAFKSRAYMMIVIGLSLTVFGLYTPFVSWFFTVLLQDSNLLEPADIHERLHFVL